MHNGNGTHFHEPSFVSPSKLLSGLWATIWHGLTSSPQQLIFVEKVDVSPQVLSTGNTWRAVVDTTVCSPNAFLRNWKKPESSAPGGRDCNWLKNCVFEGTHRLGICSLIEEQLVTCNDNTLARWLCKFNSFGLLWGMSRAAWEIINHSVYNQYWISCFAASFSKSSQENSQLLLPAFVWLLSCSNSGFPVSDWNFTMWWPAYSLSTFFSSHLCWCHINVTAPQRWGSWATHQLRRLLMLLRSTRR